MAGRVDGAAVGLRTWVAGVEAAPPPAISPSEIPEELFILSLQNFTTACFCYGGSKLTEDKKRWVTAAPHQHHGGNMYPY